MQTLIKFSILLFFCHISVIGLSCSCAYLGKVSRSEVKELKGAYIGTVVKIEKVKVQLEDSQFEIEQTHVSLLVSDVYKGEVIDTLIFYTNESSASCGISVHVNDKIFVSWSIENDIPHISMCSRSINFTLQEKRILEYKQEAKRGYNPMKYIRKTKRDLRRIKRFA